MFVEISGVPTSREPITPGMFPLPAALDTVNLAPPDGLVNGEINPGIALGDVLVPWRSGGRRLTPLSDEGTVIRPA
jgi:hypothetical protein